MLKLSIFAAVAVLLFVQTHAKTDKEIEERDANITSISMLLNMDCEACNQKRRIYCEPGGATGTGVTYSNDTATVTYTIEELNTQGFCWRGNWGTLEDNKVPTTEEGFYGSKDMTVDIDCDMGKMFYRNCSLSMLVIVVLIAVGSTLAFGAFWVVFFCCGCHRKCCKCCFKEKKMSAEEREYIENPMGAASLCAPTGLEMKVLVKKDEPSSPKSKSSPKAAHSDSDSSDEEDSKRRW